MTEDLKKRIEVALDEIRPFLANDGGNVTLVDVDGDCAKVQFEGACIDCSVNQMTLKSGIETTIKKYAPEIQTVEEISGKLSNKDIT